MFALKNKTRGALIATFALAAAVSQAITFSNVSMTFNPASLGTAASFVTGSSDIDFITPNFQVGDGAFGPARVGTLTITYEAMSDVNMLADEIIISLLGGVSGSGQIQVQEVVEDMTNPGIIGVLPLTTITSNSQLPFVSNIVFTRGSKHIKVKKDILIAAEPDTQGLDFARVGLIEQNISTVPEPATMAVLGLGALAAARRRRK